MKVTSPSRASATFVTGAFQPVAGGVRDEPDADSVNSMQPVTRPLGSVIAAH